MLPDEIVNIGLRNAKSRTGDLGLGSARALLPASLLTQEVTHLGDRIHDRGTGRWRASLW